MLNAGKNLGATLTSFRFGVRELCRDNGGWSWCASGSGTAVGRDLERCSDGAVLARGRNTSAEGDNVAWGTVVVGGLVEANSVSVNERARAGSRASR